MSNSLRPHGLSPARLLCSWNSPSKNAGVGVYSWILQARMLEWVSIPYPEDLPKPGLKHRSLTLQADSYHLSHQGLMSHWERYLNYYEGTHIPWWLKGKESICLHCRSHRGHRLDPWVGKNPWRRAWQPIPVFLPGETPGTKEPGRLQSIGSQRVRHD